jgi:hypothetical protein
MMRPRAAHQRAIDIEKDQRPRHCYFYYSLQPETRRAPLSRLTAGVLEARP